MYEYFNIATGLSQAEYALFLNSYEFFALFTSPSYLTSIKQDSYLTGIALLIPILNSLLQIQLIFFMYAILSLAKYTTYVLGDRLTEKVGNEVLSWDKFDKRHFIAIRVVSGAIYNICVLLISLFILFNFSEIILFKKGALLFGLYCSAIIIVSLSISYLIEYIFVSKKFADKIVEKVPKLKNIFFLILFLLIVITSLYAKFTQ